MLVDEKILRFICNLQGYKATVSYSFGDIADIPLYTFGIPDLNFHATILAGKDFTWEHFRDSFDLFLKLEKTNFTEKQIKFLQEEGFIVGDFKLARDSVMRLIEETNTCIENANTRILEVLQDKSIPLEIRWELFEKWPIEWAAQTFWIYKSFNPELELELKTEHEKYNPSEVIDPADLLEEMESEKSSFWKEEILEKGYRSFIINY